MSPLQIEQRPQTFFSEIIFPVHCFSIIPRFVKVQMANEMLINLLRFARRLNISVCLEFDTCILIPEPRIRGYCLENKCGNYNSNYMCPPSSGSLDEIKARVAMYRRGIIFQYSEPVDIGNDRERVRCIKKDFHKKVLKIEKFFRKQGMADVWGMIGGNCEWCKVCGAKLNEPCHHPQKARPSLESIGIDVITLLDELGMDSKFYPDRITWTGCVLF